MLTKVQVSALIESQIPFLDLPGVRPPYVSTLYCQSCLEEHYTLRCCRSIWCPICNLKISIRLSDYMNQLDHMLAKEYKRLFITLTFKNIGRIDAHTFQDFRDQFRRKFLRSKKIKALILGGFYFFDWTISTNYPSDPFNIHIHMLAYSKQYIPFHILKDQWYRATGDSYIVWIKDVKEIDHAVKEVCKYVASNKKMMDAKPEIRDQLILAIQDIRRYSKFGIAYKIKLPRLPCKCMFCGGAKFSLSRC